MRSGTVTRVSRIGCVLVMTVLASPLIAAALIYLAVLLPAVRLVHWLERRYRAP